ncbi:MAG: alpha-amylase family glycosyl hydrolase [Bacteroidia bacterium]|nr:alpha-amylase family glycosyl hydrolase [Bacteroidia bacterium]
MTLNKKSIGISLLLISCIIYTQAQVVSINPVIATADDTITVTFDATLGNAGLVGEQTVYAHTGLITSTSTSPSDWKYVQGNWGTDDARVKMTSIGNNKHTLRYHIRSFYGLPQNVTALKLAFVFRNVNGSKEGKNTDGSDIYIDLSQGGFFVQFKSPLSPQVLKQTDSITVAAVSSSKCSLALYQNNNIILSAANDSILSIRLAASALGVGKHNFAIVATLNGDTRYDSTYITVRPASPPIATLPVGVKDGINYTSDTTATLVLFAPNKSFVYVIGDFNNWEFDNQFLMNKTPDGSRYWIQLNNLQPGTEYAFQYVIDDAQLRIADYYTQKVLDPWNDGAIPSVTYPNLKPYPVGKTSQIVSVLKTGEQPFVWNYTDTFRRPPSEKLVIYELLVRDFIARHDYQTLKDTLSYLKRLGVNAIELMPINEFEGNESWGYNVSFYFAPDKYYGTKQALQEFIDECHRQGFAVILDMVLNHSFGQSPMVRMYFDPSAGQYGQPTAQNPWFNQTDKHPFGVGYDFNHEALPTQQFTDSVIHFWLTEYKVDGYRFDLSKGFSQKFTGTDVGAWSAYDQSRINIWKRIMAKVRTYDTSAYMILEHLGANDEETVLANEGFLLWGNLNYNYNEATMGYASSSDLNWGNYKQRGWNKPNLVTYAESHDEERLVNKNIRFGNSNNPLHNVKDSTLALKRIEAAMCLLLPLRGPKMIWQFGEVGYDYSIDFNGRVGNKPIRWDYMNDPRRKRIYEVTATLNRLKITDDSLSTTNYTYNAGATAIKRLVIASQTTKASIIANFGVTAAPVTITFPEAGTWYSLFQQDSIVISGTEYQDTLGPGEYRVYLNRYETTTLPTAITERETTWVGTAIYPNPSNGLFSIKTGVKDDGNPIQIRIVSITGQLVWEHTEQKSAEFIHMNLEKADVKPGIYLVQLTKGGQQVHHKLIYQ